METAAAGAGVESPERGGAFAVALDFPVGSVTPRKVPRRIRRRLLEGRSSAPLSAEEIEAKLRDADVRRQQFHEWLQSKARPKPRSPSWSSQEEDLSQRLEAKLCAAEQKRLSLLAKAQMRLARLDELRQAAKTGIEMRFEKEREELVSKVESRVQHAEENRMRLLKAYMQRRAVAKERTAKSLLQRIIRENKYKECVCSAISQKRAAAEKKRMGLLEAEKTKAHARVMQARRVAKAVCHQRESERRRLREKLETKLQRAKRQRAEYLKQRGSPYATARTISNKHGEYLSRKLARCWRQFVKSKRTTVDLARAFQALEINENSVNTMPFEQLALSIESATTLQTVKAFLDRLECRFLLSCSRKSSDPQKIDHLLQRLASPKRRVTPARVSGVRAAKRKEMTRVAKNSEKNRQTRYPVRVVLCAYMILGHPHAVFSGQGEQEIVLAESAAKFVRELELLVKVILDGPPSAHSSRLSFPDISSADYNKNQDSPDSSSKKQTFRTQLEAFDKAWCNYLYCFVVWKVKDARSLEDDLVRAACQLEVSMMQTCRLSPDGQTGDLTHDMRAIQRQVNEDQQLLREKVLHLGGDEGIARMESALSETRSKFFEAKESGSPSVGPVAHIASPGASEPSEQSSSSIIEDPSMDDQKKKRVIRSLFGHASSPPKLGKDAQTEDSSPTENELIVNEIVHAGITNFGVGDIAANNVKTKVKETMEKAFWDGVMESMKGVEPDIARILDLVKEVRDELHGLAPQSWKQEITESIDLDILSQLLKSGAHDLNYLGRILEYALVMLQKLSAPANEEEMKRIHIKMLRELAAITQSEKKDNSSFVFAVIKGLRFVLEQIQNLKQEISKARMQMMEPIIKGPAGLDYLHKAFAERYGPPSPAASSLPRTRDWVSTLSNTQEEWHEHNDAKSALATSNNASFITLRAGSTIPLASKEGLSKSYLPPSAASGGEQLQCSGEKIDVMIRLGLLKLVSQVQGLTLDTVPETFELNFLRLRTVQSQYQQIIVLSTSMLVLRQVLLSENSAISHSELENIISDSIKTISKMLVNSNDVGIHDIIQVLASSSSDIEHHQTRKEVLGRLLTKSLQDDDPVFKKVSRAIYLAARAIVLGGSGGSGRNLAEALLRRVGASTLLDQVVKLSEVLIILANVSCHVHGPWYRCLV